MPGKQRRPVQREVAPPAHVDPAPGYDGYQPFLPAMAEAAPEMPVLDAVAQQDGVEADEFDGYVNFDDIVRAEAGNGGDDYGVYLPADVEQEEAGEYDGYVPFGEVAQEQPEGYGVYLPADELDEEAPYYYPEGPADQQAQDQAPVQGPAAKYGNLATLGEHYGGEHEEAQFRGGHQRNENGEITRQVTTQRLDDQARETTRINGGQDGLLHDANGLVDSTGARPGLANAGADRKIFVMDSNGGMFMEDALGATRRESNQAHYDFFHHSSFLGGEDVAAAGDMVVRDGWVKNVSNNSGHYRPGQEQLLNSLDELDDMGVNTDASRVDLHNAQGHHQYSAGEFRESRANTGLLDARQAMRAELLRDTPRID